MNFKHQKLSSLGCIYYESLFKHFERRSCRHHPHNFLRIYSNSCFYLVFIFPLLQIWFLCLSPGSFSCCFIWIANLKVGRWQLQPPGFPSACWFVVCLSHTKPKSVPWALTQVQNLVTKSYNWLCILYQTKITSTGYCRAKTEDHSDSFFLFHMSGLQL